MSFDLGGMMEKIRNMQTEMEETKRRLKEIKVSAESGGGMVKVTMSCDTRVKSIDIDDAILKSEDMTMITDLIVAATNKAIEEVEKTVEQEMGKLKDGIPNIPGLNLGL
ncbi:MAG: YbaB/EbfC family nucleoid-associated protein [Candidatus Kapaibacterium sp.]|nr:YbaB/EbfC family nucleoid-associated protein [Ignavibacteriota bacterium]MCB9220218.1 YbaB/EbfC family nucleoid-associated protein [Ignavibacteria bacterium]